MIQKLTTLFLSVLLLAGTVFGVLPSSVYAADITTETCKTLDNKPAICADAASGRSSNPLVGPSGIVTKAVQLLIAIGGVIAIFVLLINGVRMITSMGNSESFNSARNGIIFAVVGLVIVLLAQTIVVFVIKKL